MRAFLLVMALSSAGWAAPPPAVPQGEQVYGRCLACHAIEQHRTGPAHCGLFGRRAGTAPGFAHYSDALRKSGIVWNDQTLSKFLADPMNAVPGTNMTYLGVTDAGERKALIDWMRHATKDCRMPK